MQRLLVAFAALIVVAFAGPAFANDSLAKVRTTMAADKAAQATTDANQQSAIAAQTAVNAAQDARLKALEDKLAAMGTAAVQPAPGPAIPTTVAAKGEQAVWNLQFRAAPVTTKNLLNEVAAKHPLPACWSFDAPTKILYVTCDSDETGWDLQKVRIYNQGAHKLTLRNSLLCGIATLDYCVRNGDDGGTVASVLELYGCRIFGKNTAGLLSSWSTVNSSAKAIFRSYDTDWIDADYRFLSAFSAEIVRNWFGRVAVQTSPGAHIEQLFLWSDATVRDSLLDATGSNAPGASGNIQSVGGKQTLSGNIFRGANDIKAYVAIQGAAGVTLALTDNIIEPGMSAANSPTGGYIAKNGGQAIPSGNVAWASGASIDAAITAAQ